MLSSSLIDLPADVHDALFSTLTDMNPLWACHLSMACSPLRNIWKTLLPRTKRQVNESWCKQHLHIRKRHRRARRAKAPLKLIPLSLAEQGMSKLFLQTIRSEPTLLNREYVKAAVRNNQHDFLDDVMSVMPNSAKSVVAREILCAAIKYRKHAIVDGTLSWVASQDGEVAVQVVGNRHSDKKEKYKDPFFFAAQAGNTDLLDRLAHIAEDAPRIESVIAGALRLDQRSHQLDDAFALNIFHHVEGWILSRGITYKLIDGAIYPVLKAPIHHDNDALFLHMWQRVRSHLQIYFLPCAPRLMMKALMRPSPRIMRLLTRHPDPEFWKVSCHELFAKVRRKNAALFRDDRFIECVEMLMESHKLSTDEHYGISCSSTIIHAMLSGHEKFLKLFMRAVQNKYNGDKDPQILPDVVISADDYTCALLKRHFACIDLVIDSLSSSKLRHSRFCIDDAKMAKLCSNAEIRTYLFQDETRIQFFSMRSYNVDAIVGLLVNKDDSMMSRSIEHEIRRRFNELRTNKGTRLAR